MLPKCLHPTLRCVAGLVSVVLLKAAIHTPSSSSGYAMAALPSGPTSRGDNNGYRQHGSRDSSPDSSSSSSARSPFFDSLTSQVLTAQSNPVQLNYGVAVTDVDNDGELEIVVAGYNGPNLVLKYNSETRQLENIAIDDERSPYYALRDVGGQAIGVCACDVDGDGREEMYFLNTNSAYWGRKTYPDKLFKWRNGRYEDLLSDEGNRGVSNDFAGRSVACIDRKGNGLYSIYLANYANPSGIGACAMIEMDEEMHRTDGVIRINNVAEEVGVRKFIGGRGVTVGPILNEEGRSDLFCDNERGPNFMYKNRGDGTFEEVARSVGIDDPSQNGRGVALADFNGDGRLDIVYGNWMGPHRLYLQERDGEGNVHFRNVATEEMAREMAQPTPIRTVIPADFDNDGVLEIFFNNIVYRGPAPNKLFRVKPTRNGNVKIKQLNPGDATEPTGYGTGGAVTDFDNDGRLELIVSHGESSQQPLTVYRASRGANNNWLRVMPLTRYGAPARGAVVKVRTQDGRSQLRVIDGGSGYLCQMEPVAHFGFRRNDVPVSIEITWPDTQSTVRNLATDDINSRITIPHPSGATSNGNSTTTVTA